MERKVCFVVWNMQTGCCVQCFGMYIRWRATQPRIGHCRLLPVFTIKETDTSSMSNCNAGLRCIIWRSISLFDGEYRKKSAMSNPLLRCSSSDVHSKTLDTTTRLHILDNKADFSFQCSVAPKSGMRVTSLPLRTCIASLLKQPFFPPVASHI